MNRDTLLKIKAQLQATLKELQALLDADAMGDQGPKQQDDIFTISTLTANRLPVRISETFDFLAIYKLYPRKVGKTQGLKKCVKDVKSESDYEALKTAVGRFIAHHKAQATEPHYIPHFSTFMTSWRDWLDPQTGQVQILAPNTETTAQYLARKQIDDMPRWEETDPRRVKAILDRALGRRTDFSDGRTETQEGLLGDVAEDWGDGDD